MVVNPNRLVATLVVVCAAARVTGHGMITFPASRVGGTLDQAAERGDMDMQTFANASWCAPPRLPPPTPTHPHGTTLHTIHRSHMTS